MVSFFSSRSSGEGTSSFASRFLSRGSAGTAQKAVKTPDFDEASWRAKFDAVLNKMLIDGQELRRLRLEVQHSTIAALNAGCYVDCNGKVVELPVQKMEAGLLSRTVYSEENLTPSPRRTMCLDPKDVDPFGGTEVEVKEVDCLQACWDMLDKHPNESVAVLNMANQTYPGGGWLNGAGAQEENLHRRTNLCDHLSNHRGISVGKDVQYPLPEFGGAFSSNVCIFRGREEDGYPFLPEDRVTLVSVITVAAYRQPRCEKGWLCDAKERGTYRKMLMMLRMAKHHRVSNLVLSAFGCGAFLNPPTHIAELFKEALCSDEFRGEFRRVVFAIIEDHNSRRDHADGLSGNVAPFKRTFEVDAFQEVAT
eukprot:gnl/TRDRNA2_/TRDRNA2_129164_c0_seq2.p1 gnl/TRDRNA2_/TRDRNA2_129164_c0~~gnl/TRDRNA2_/TRDRNA2_129164_c0_seq2.p1  ORF type:complete len:365 (-),score=55.06 gnl/TRDRNA2_/TRDRNA2_129164_c0_seq2:181-1275(-)